MSIKLVSRGNLLKGIPKIRTGILGSLKGQINIQAQQREVIRCMTTSFPAKKEAGQLRVQNADEESKEAIRFPCIDRLEKRETALKVQHEEVQRSGESTRDELFLHVVSGYEVFEHKEDFVLSHGGKLPGFKVAYETWGELNANKDNAILLHTGLSASSHAKSHAKNTKAGWWEEFIGPGLAIDTNKYFVICTNVLGGCYGSTGPSSINPKTGKRYATRFPILTINDMIHAQFLLLDHLGINKLHASVGSSMGGMQSLAAACLYPERVGRLIAISSCAISHPYSIALRFAQRQVLLSDPHFNRGEYYDGIVPHVGMKLARQISTITYRSGPEWEQRFGRRRQNIGSKPALCPDFMIESYIDHQSEKFCLNYDANSLLYISKAMDMFDITKSNTSRLEQQRKVAIEKEKKVQKEETVQGYELEANPDVTTNSDFIKKEKGGAGEAHKISDEKIHVENIEKLTAPHESRLELEHDLIKGVENAKMPVLILGVQSDILFPVVQQKEIADILRRAGNTQIRCMAMIRF